MRLNVELAKKILGNSEEGREFHDKDGNVFRNLSDMEERLREMSDEAFLSHIKDGRNDFSDWVRECLGDVRLADSLIGLDKEGSLRKIKARIGYVEKYLEDNQ